MAKLCKFRPSDSLSPRRELQEFIQGLGSSISLRRPRFGLSETKSRSGKSGSPKRGREEFCVWLSTNPRPGEEIWVFKRMGSRSGEMGSPKRDKVVQPLFHARSGEVDYVTSRQDITNL